MLFNVMIIVHIILALTVSAHVLLAKRESRAAIGWLGVAWLSPLVGSLAYYIFGINRVARRALKLRKAGPSRLDKAKSISGEGSAESAPYLTCPIRTVGDALSHHPVVQGNHVEVFQNGDEAYPEMIAAIAGARKSIALTSYIFRTDENGLVFIDALNEAKKRGVDIKVLVDGVGGGIFKCPAITKLNELGIDAHRFMLSLMPLQMPNINLRNHKKLLIIDGQLGFVGGMNLGGENLLQKKKQQQVRDTHFCFSGPVVQQLQESFIEDWYFTTDEELRDQNWWPQIEKSGEIEARVINSGPDHDLASIEKLFSAAINGAKHHIRIVTPYFLPEERISFLLEMAVLRGVTVELLIPQHTDFSLFDWAMESQLDFMQANKIACYRSTLPFDHSKLLTVDGKWCAVGSPNWDVRSMRLNFEILVECYDQTTTRKIDRIIDEKIQTAIPHKKTELAWSNLPMRLRNAGARLLLPYL